MSVSDTYFYRVFDNNCDTDRVTINGKIDKIVKLPKNLNIILNIDSMCGNIVHIPMISDIYIEYDLIKQLINIKDLSLCIRGFNNVIIESLKSAFSSL